MRLTRPALPAAFVITVLMALALPPGLSYAQEAEEPVTVDPAEATAPVEMAKLRFLVGHQHGPADIYVDGQLIEEALEFGRVTGYVDVPAGDRLLETVGGGMSLDEARGNYDSGLYPNVAEATQALKADRMYTAVLNQVDTGVEFKVVGDTPKPKPGRAEARVVSMCWACGPMSYGISGSKKPLAKYLHYPEDKLAGKYAKVDTGELDLIPRLSGAKGPLTDFDPIDVEPGTSNSLFVVGQDTSSVALVPAVDAALSSVRFINASRGGPAYDVYVDGKKAAKRLGARGYDPKLADVLAGDHLVQVVEAGMKPADGVIREGTVSFPPGPAVVETGAGQTLEAVAAPGDLGPKAKTPQVRFAHGDPETPAVDIQLEGLPTIEGLEAGQWTEYFELPTSSTYAWIRPSADPNDIYHETPIDLPSGNVTAFLGGTPAGEPTVELVFVEEKAAKNAKKR